MLTKKIEPIVWTPKTTLLFCVVILLSYFTYVQGYNNPPNLFWDENYHIASAQKYLNGVFFMEPHPPLGKLLIALGEKLVHGNELNNQFIDTDYGKNIPKGFSFAGYRLFPTLLGWLTAPLFFLVFLLITRNPLAATILSFLYIFDNAIIVHTRGAMLDSTLLFFSTLCILTYLLALQWKEKPSHFAAMSLLWGLSFGCVMTTKLNGLIVILLAPALLFVIRKQKKQCMRFIGYGLVGFLCTYVGIWQLHFSLASTVNPQLKNEGFYRATPVYQNIVNEGRSHSILLFPTMWSEHMNFASHYQTGVPELNLCKADENGSPWFLWPIGGRTINYRWETVQESIYRYLYLVPNPAGWLITLAAILIAGALLVASKVLDLKKPLKNEYQLFVFVGLYTSYMIIMSRIDRVMYMYHYFLPLSFGFIVVALVFAEIDQWGKRKLTERSKMVFLFGVAAIVFLFFQAYRPFSYYLPISDSQVQKRELIQLWDLRCVKCKKDNPIARP